MLGSLILVFALCTDTFVASLAYGANRVHVGWGKVALLNGICSGCLGLALGLGNVISSVLPGDVTRIICFVSLFLDSSSSWITASRPISTAIAVSAVI